MSRPSPASRPRDRPPPPVPAAEGEEGPPPVPKPRAAARGVGRRTGGGNLPSWPPPGYGGSSPSPSSPAAPTRAAGSDHRAPPPAPPPSSSPAPSPVPTARSPAPQTPQQPELPPFRPPISPPVPSGHPQLPSPTPAPPTPGANANSFAFGTCLQESHEAINKRHEEELHALESFRAHVFFRAKADREYAQELAKINSRANKTLATISQSSAIVQVHLCLILSC